MAEQKSGGNMFGESLPTFVAVSFILGLLAFALSMWDFVQIRQVFHAVAMVSNVNTDATNASLHGLETKIADLEKQIKELERSKGAEAPPAGGAEAGAADAEGKAGKHKNP